MSQVGTQEFEELSIGTIDGLRAFFKNVQVQYNVGLQKESILMEQGNYEYGNALHDIFQKVRDTTNRLIDSLKQGDSVTQRDAEELQSHYDRLIRIIANTQVRKLVPEEKKQQPPKQVAETKRTEKTIKPESAPVLVAIPVQTQTSAQPKSAIPSAQQPETKLPPATPVRPQTQPKLVPQEIKDNLVKKKSTEFASRTRSIDASEIVIVKPKTGALKISSEDKQTKRIQTKSSSAATDKKPESQKESVQEIKQKESTSASSKETSPKIDYRQRILTVLDLSRDKYQELKAKYPEPNVVQDLLLEEVREGLEQLELMSKKSNVTKNQLEAVSEVMSHIKYAMESIVDAEAEILSVEEQDVFQVPIVTERAQESLHAKTKLKQAVSFVPSSITTRKSTVVKRSVPKQLQTLPRPADIYETESLTEKYLTAPRYINFITEHYSSLAGFERMLDATITKIESDTIDQLDKWLGDLPASAFSFVKDMPVAEFYIFAKRPYEVVTSDLQNENIKYETFCAWRDLTDEMLELIPSGSDMKYGQLFANWMVELAMQDVE